MKGKRRVWHPLQVIAYINLGSEHAYDALIDLAQLWPSIRAKLIAAGAFGTETPPVCWTDMNWAILDHSVFADFEIGDLDEIDGHSETDVQGQAADRLSAEVLHAALDQKEVKVVNTFLNSYLHLDPPYFRLNSEELKDFSSSELAKLCEYATAFCAEPQVILPEISDWTEVARKLSKAKVLPKTAGENAPHELSKLHWRKVRRWVVLNEMAPVDPWTSDRLQPIMSRFGISAESCGGYKAKAVRREIPRNVGRPRSWNKVANPHFRGVIDYQEVRPLSDYILRHHPRAFTKVQRSLQRENHANEAVELERQAFFEKSAELELSCTVAGRANIKQELAAARERKTVLNRRADKRHAVTSLRMGSEDGLADFSRTLLGSMNRRRGSVAKGEVFEKFRGPVAEMALRKLLARAQAEVGESAAPGDVSARLNSYPELRRLNAWKHALWGKPVPTWAQILKGLRADQ